MKRVLLVDIGATNTRLAIGWEEENQPTLYDIVQKKTPSSGEALVDRIVGYARKRKELSMASIASIGPLDLRKGWILETPNISIGPYPIVETLRSKLRVPVVLLNDCQAAVWGEFIYGKYRGTKNMVYITLSSGVGAGAIVDGHLLIGKRGNAHEVGHFIVNFDGKVRCGCGGLGHWEAYVGGKNIPRNAWELINDYSGSKTPFYYKIIGNNFTVEELFNYATEADPVANYLIEKILMITAAGISGVIAAYDPEIIILGGTLFHKGLSRVLDKIVNYLKLYSLHENVTLSVSSYPAKEPLVGALAAGIHPVT
ncbi:MAG: ROK family protein [Desulfurococcales archaeon]|nr:ROK family protein [Desulfurococcales archaeon]